jgi:NAD(P)-dependent dehydrogenase (short-subunit alcohol dehydrogenase family)
VYGEDAVRGLKDKRFVVAGGATGIGAATATRLAEEGAKVVVGDVNRDGLNATIAKITANGGIATGVYFDLADNASAQALIKTCVDAYGGVDGLANVGADLSLPSITTHQDLLELSDENWQRELDCNLMGYTRTIRAVIPHLVKQKSGAIVNTSSTAAYMAEPVRAAYATVKAGINALTRNVARRWGPDNIRCNSVAPGLTMSEANMSKMPAEEREQLLATIPLNRGGTPEELAAVYAYLLSDDGAWVTGQVWSVNGGAYLRD